MPQVVVEHQRGQCVPYGRIKEVLNEILPQVFPYRGKVLDGKTEFDIDFREKNHHAQLICPMVVRITVHSTPQRLHDTDGKARQIREALGQVMPASAVGVQILVAEVGWSADAYDGVIE